MSATPYEYKVGTSSGSLVLLRTLGVMWPRHDFIRYPAILTLASGGQKGMGLPQTNWYWDFITYAQWSLLFAYRTGFTTPIWLRTKDDVDAWHTYTADMIWPANTQWSVTRALKFQLSFRNMVQQA